MEDELTPEEYRAMLEEQARMQGVQGGFISPNEMAEYVALLAEDKSFHLDDQGDIKDGNVPKENMLKYWAVNNKNYVWGNLSDRHMRKRIELMEIDFELADGMYEINWKLAKENKELQSWALREKQQVLDKINQRIHGFVRKSRTIGADRERKLLDTRTGQFGSDNQNQKQSLMSKITGGLIK